MTTFDQDDNWISQVFGETEAAKLRQAAKDIQAEHEEAQSQGDEIATTEFMFHRNQLVPFLEWLHEMWWPMHQSDPTGLMCKWLRAIGCSLTMAYLCDPLWDYDEQLSEYAVAFGAADMFGSHHEDIEEDEDDDDDT